MDMEYRRLGKTGLKVSVLSFGSWVTFGPQLSGDLAEDCLAAAYDAGVKLCASGLVPDAKCRYRLSSSTLDRGTT